MHYVLYHPEVESAGPDENQIIDEILASMRRLDGRTKAVYGRNMRLSHTKSYGLAVGEMTVMDNLPEHLAQGLFARGARYPVIIRMTNAPGEILPDTVNTERGFALKILGVNRPMLAGHDGQTTQDFVLGTGDRFAFADASAFLRQHHLIAHAPQFPTAVKEGLSTVARVMNSALHALGTDSAKLDFFGDSRIHPLAEAYFSQAPIRYGNYIAKLAVVPVSAAQRALADAEVKVDATKDPDALRTATVEYLKDRDADFEVRIQLCTDLTTMPVEDASKEWREDESPYLPVARIRLPQQDAHSDARQMYMESLSFSVSHSLEAHRPLGSIMRARLRVYPEMARLRRLANHQPLTEPDSIDQVPV